MCRGGGPAQASSGNRPGWIGVKRGHSCGLRRPGQGSDLSSAKIHLRKCACPALKSVLRLGSVRRGGRESLFVPLPARQVSASDGVISLPTQAAGRAWVFFHLGSSARHTRPLPRHATWFLSAVATAAGENDDGNQFQIGSAFRCSFRGRGGGPQPGRLVPTRPVPIPSIGIRACPSLCRQAEEGGLGTPRSAPPKAPSSGLTPASATTCRGTTTAIRMGKSTGRSRRTSRPSPAEVALSIWAPRSALRAFNSLKPTAQSRRGYTIFGTGSNILTVNGGGISGTGSATNTIAATSQSCRQQHAHRRHRQHPPAEQPQ